MLKTEFDPLYDSAQTDLHRTDYEYDSDGFLTKVVQSADVTSGTRPEISYTNNAQGQVTSMTDPESRVTSYTYDDLGRKTKTTYPDTSTEQTLYGTGTSAGRVIKTKDRVDTVTSYAYDSAGRLEKTTVGAAIDADILDGNPDDTTITNVNLQQITEYTYLDGSKTFRHRPRCN